MGEGQGKGGKRKVEGMGRETEGWKREEEWASSVTSSWLTRWLTRCEPKEGTTLSLPLSHLCRKLSRMFSVFRHHAVSNVYWPVSIVQLCEAGFDIQHDALWVTN